jgi:hypothetical protein
VGASRAKILNTFRFPLQVSTAIRRVVLILVLGKPRLFTVVGLLRHGEINVSKNK